MIDTMLWIACFSGFLEESNARFIGVFSAIVWYSSHSSKLENCLAVAYLYVGDFHWLRDL